MIQEVKVPQERKELTELKVQMEHKVQRVLPVFKELMVLKVLKVQMEEMVVKVLPEFKVLQVHKELKEI